MFNGKQNSVTTFRAEIALQVIDPVADYFTSRAKDFPKTQEENV